MTFNDITPEQLAAHQREVHEVNVEKGWFDKPVSFLEAMALLITEIVEVNDAHITEGLRGGWKAGPQMASEFADIYIRLLDDCERFKFDLGADLRDLSGSYSCGIGQSFDSLCMQLTRRVRDIIEAYRKHGLGWTTMSHHLTLPVSVVNLFLELQDACEELGVDLGVAFEAKMAVNRTRPYRHGGKIA
jgi:hypothetical protein